MSDVTLGGIQVGNYVRLKTDQDCYLALQGQVRKVKATMARDEEPMVMLEGRDDWIYAHRFDVVYPLEEELAQLRVLAVKYLEERDLALAKIATREEQIERLRKDLEFYQQEHIKAQKTIDRLEVQRDTFEQLARDQFDALLEAVK